MSEIRTVQSTESIAHGDHRCDFCGDLIARGERYRFYRGFDPDHRGEGAAPRGAWVTDRRHLRCTPEALNSKAS